MVYDETSKMLKETFMQVIREKLEIAESTEQANEIIKKIEKIDLNDFYKKAYSDIADNAVKYMKDEMYKEVMFFRTQEQEFLARQEQKWCNAFVASEAMYIMVLEAAEAYSKYVDSLNEKEREGKTCRFTAMIHIHGRALQEFLEIITLMKNGFADGAYARWRSMYELTVISSFISKYGENVAKAYIDACDTQDRYEWARSSGIFSLDKKYISFNDIQRSCDINTTVWKNQYILANRTIHASSQGTFARLGNMRTENIIPVGRSDYGITTPAEHSAISLAQITTMFLGIFPYGDGVVAMKYINEWIDIIREKYFKTHDEVFPDDEPLWDEDIIKNKNEID
ncbi:DUF5677 domain-containing protein [Clostridium saccharobutylicum]|uniref:Uncharacterized protein n=1 Tax=Clostridium saccharobutylicum TaxID=169679 RepID=A0A1S8MQB9_CLOSA|nr:DUF5677 domain-containing protein [Clostridium saccharobutylicum]OOM06384.1 hypothetical protein CLOSAC_43040 [Clostridium saccharobutylicum]